MNFTSFRYLWMGQACANLGDILYIVALITILFESTQSALFLAMLPFFNAFGRFVGGMSGPIWLNRYLLKKILIIPQWSKTLLLLVLSTVVEVNQPAIPIVLGFVLTIAVLDGCQAPAARAMLPRLVSEQTLIKANSFFSVVTQSIQLIGWAVGGILVSFIGGSSVLWFTVFLFGLSSLLMVFITDSSTNRQWQNSSVSLKTISVGWSIIWNRRLFRRFHFVIFLDTMANVVWIAAIIYVFVAEVLKKPEAYWGAINTTFFIGLIAGGWLVGRISRTMPKRTYMLGAAVGSNLCTIWFGFNTVPWLALGLSVVFGITEQIKSIAIDTTFQTVASSEELPLLYSAQEALVTLTFGTASLGFGWLADELGVKSVFLIAGCLMMLGTTILWKRT